MLRDARALSFDWTPEDVHHRESEIDHLSSCLAPIPEGRAGSHALIWGPTGVGKTMLAGYVTRELRKETPAVRVGEVNCQQESSETGILAQLVSDLGLGTLPREAASRGKCLDRIRGIDEQTVLVLDEVDTLPEIDLLGVLLDLKRTTLLMTCINDQQLLSGLSRRVRDRVQTADSVHLQRYSRSALEDIIWQRVEHGLDQGAASPEAVEAISEHAAGTARKAISLLRKAVERARDQGIERIEPELVDAVVEDATRSMHEWHEERLGSHQRLLLDIIREHGEIGSGLLHEQFERRASRVIGRSQRRRLLKSLRAYGRIEKQGQTSNVTYRYVEP